MRENTLLRCPHCRKRECKTDEWERRWNRPPTRPEIDGVISSYVREDILYRQAVAKGLKSQRQSGCRLVSQPQPRELDHRRTKPSVPSFRDALFASDGSALPGRRSKTGVGGELPSVGEMPEQPFRPQDHGELGTDALGFVRR